MREQLSGAAQLATLAERHQPSGLNSQHFHRYPTFAAYLESMRTMLYQARADLSAALLQKAVEGNAPFELKPDDCCLRGKQTPYQRGILLVHGLSDSPYFMRHLGAFFQAQGFKVHAMLLPGHGSRPGDLLEVHWQEWVSAVNAAIEQLALEVEEIYLGGFSAGGALSVYHAACDHRIRGLFLFAPALQVSPKAAWANMHRIYSWLMPAAKWLAIHEDVDLYKYESFPKNAAAQMHALTRSVASRLSQYPIQVPVFAAVSQDDATVDTRATVSFIQTATHPLNKLVYYYSDPQRLPSGDFIEPICGVFPSQHIVSSAHTAIVLPSDDEHYGVRGRYRNCLHYSGEQLNACLHDDEMVRQGEITDQNLQFGVTRRLMYNPNFEIQKQAMRKFIEHLPE